MKTKYFLMALAMALLVAMAGLTQAQGASGREPSAVAAALQPPAVAVETIKVTPADFSERIGVVGTLTAKWQAEVKSEYAGIVNEIYVSQWVPVKKGERLARLDLREPQALVNRAGAAVEMARADQLQAKAAMARAERELARLENLKTSGLATRQSLEEAQTEREVAQARVEAATAQMRSAEYENELARTRFAKTVITAPIDGVIALRGVNVGDLVGEAGSNRVLFRLVDNRLLDLKVTVPARHVGSLKPGLPLTFTTASFPERIFEGRITYINPSVNAVDRSMQVLAEVPNDPMVLRDGMFVEGHILIRQRAGVLQVPRGAMVSWEMESGNGTVFVVEGGVARRRTVRIGSVEQERLEILEGLSAGEEVINGGGFNVKDGLAVQTRNTK